MTNQTCARCGLPRSKWMGDDGKGIPVEGETYCCEGCAKGKACTCVSSEKENHNRYAQGPLTEKEDIDPYNADDKQPPFEEKSPRQRAVPETA